MALNFAMVFLVASAILSLVKRKFADGARVEYGDSENQPNPYGNFSATSAHIQKHCLHMHFYPNQPPELPWPG